MADAIAGSTRADVLHIASQLKGYSTSNASDALDRLRIKGGLQGLLPIVDNVRICGPAFTVRWLPAEQEARKPWKTYIDHAMAGDVLVIDNGGRMNCTVWGDLLSRRAIEIGIQGTVLDGVCRDVKEIRSMNYPVFSRGRFMMTGKDRLQLDSFNAPVTVSDVLVSPGDFILADDNGVVCIPKRRAGEVLTALEEISDRESKIMDAVKQGKQLADAREQFGYGELQRPRE